MKVGHFLNYMSMGGTENMIVSLMQKSEHDSVYVTFRAVEERRKQFKKLDLELVELGDKNVTGAVKFMKENVDIVHAANSGGPEPGVHIGIESGKPVIETCQSPSLPQGHSHDQVTVVVVSRGIWWYWPENIQDKVIYSCAEPVKRHPSKKAKEYFNLDPGRPVVGRLGRLEGIKRPQDFVRAAEPLGRERPDVQFLLVGSGSDGAGVKQLARKLKTTRDIEITMPGFLTGKEKDLAYSAMDVMLYPTSMEGFGIVFAEAMSIGLPIVTYSDPVNIDVVGCAGLFVSDNEYAHTNHPFRALARVTIDLLENPREWEKLSKRGEMIYNSMYRPEIMAKQYDELYEELVDGNAKQLSVAKPYFGEHSIS